MYEALHITPDQIEDHLAYLKRIAAG